MIEYEPWLRQLVAKSSHPFVRDSEAAFRYLLEVCEKLPSAYRWRATSVEGFREQVNGVEAPDDKNRIYWQDMAKSIQVFNMTLVWRATEIGKATLRLLNDREVLAPATLSRSMLEMAAAAIVNSNNIQATVQDCLANASTSNVVVCEELELLVRRMMYGTRIGEPTDDLKQTNPVTHIQRVTKSPGASELRSVYEFLCDVTHPSVVGNARFWAAIESKDEHGNEIRRIERLADTITTAQIREKTLWSLGWSSACIRNAFEIGQDAVRRIVQRWPTGTSRWQA